MGPNLYIADLKMTTQLLAPSAYTITVVGACCVAYVHNKSKVNRDASSLSYFPTGDSLCVFLDKDADI